MKALDAVPKKRGPKTDVLEALLKRVDGLERRLKDEKKSQSSSNEGESAADKESPNGDAKPKRPQLDTATLASETAVYSPTPIRCAFSISIELRKYLRLVVNLRRQLFSLMFCSIHISPGAMVRHIISSTKRVRDNESN